MKILKQFLLTLTLLCISLHARAESADLARTRSAAKKGDPVAQFFLGLRYYEGFGGVSKDYSEAAKWWLKSAEQSFPDAEQGIADLYYKGIGVEQDYGLALKWAKRSALHGNSVSCLSISTIYMKGQGTPQDLILAYAWLSIHTPSDDSKRELQRKYLSVLELKLSQGQLLKAKSIADELRAEIRSNSK